MKRLLLTGLTTLALCVAPLASMALAAGSAEAASSAPAQAASVASGQTASELTKTDLDAWLDGFMPYALSQGDIAGAVVVVVKDGQILTQRGFGYANLEKRQRVDPQTTMFRIGSISKVFTWIAVMQLQEQGKIDLDADVNKYLDFQIPAYKGLPMTMRHLMTHTAGFEEAIKGGDLLSGGTKPLGEVLRVLLPKRVFAPGSTPAYSNYGAALAGYIVERVSGQSFEQYVTQHIFAPLGMKHSSTLQDLPAGLAPFMSAGYDKASGSVQPFEIISVSPAGGISASGGDMAKFMNAQLGLSPELLQPKTAAMMIAPSAQIFLPSLNRMALGVYQQQMNGLQAVGHGGDLRFAHSYMWLVPASRLGIFVSMNSSGVEGANWALRQALFEQFADRYFPSADAGGPVELPTAKEDAQALVGSYINQRTWLTNFMDILNLTGQTKISLDDDGRPVFTDPLGGAPSKWIEVSPLVWKAAHRHQRLAAKVEDGKAVRWSLDAVSPFMVWDRAPWYRDSTWLLPSVTVSTIILLITALSWPIGAIARRKFNAPLTLAGKRLLDHRLLKSAASLLVLTLVGWTLVFSSQEALAAGTMDWAIVMMEVLSALAAIGLVAASLFRLWTSFATASSVFRKLFAGIFAASSTVVVWVMLAFHLISFGVGY